MAIDYPVQGDSHGFKGDGGNLRESDVNQGIVATYLSDHRGGASSAVQILERLISQSSNESLTRCLTGLLQQIKSDIVVLEQIANLYPHNKTWFKRFLGRFAGILSGVKFNKRFAGRFGEFEALEFISLGILGKRALWRVLKEAEVKEVRALAIDLDRLIKSAQIQYEEVESWRLTLGKDAFQNRSHLDKMQ